MNHSKVVTRSLFGMVALLLVLAPLARGQVLNQVPQDAPVVIKVKSLQAVSDKIAAMAKAWGIDQFPPAQGALANPLQAMQARTHLNAGINPAGDMAIVITELPQGGQEPTLLILIPVSDYKAFLGNFQNPQTEGDVTTVTFENDARPSYVASRGAYAALGNKKEALTVAAAGLKVQGQAAQELEKKDIVIFGNASLLRTRVLPQLQQNREMIVGQVERMLQNSPEGPKYVPIAKTVVNQMLDRVQILMQDLQAATLGFDLSEGGIGTTFLTQVEANSVSARRLAQLKGSNELLLSGLPDVEYLVMGGGTRNSEALTQMFDEVVGPIRQQLTDLGQQGKTIQKWMDSFRTLIANSEGQTFGFIKPTNPQAGLFQGVSVVRGKADVLLPAMKQQVETQQEVMALIQPQNQPNPVKTTVTPNSKTVEGVAFDQVKMEVDPQMANTPQGAQVSQMFQMMYGPQGFEVYMGKVDDKHVLTVMGGDEALMGQAIKSAKGNDDAVAQRAPVKAVASKLPQNRLGTAFIRIDNIVQTGLDFAKQMGMQMNVQMKPDLQPVGVSVAAENNTIRIDSYLPSEVMESLISGAMQVQGQMQQGRQPGGPAGL